MHSALQNVSEFLLLLQQRATVFSSPDAEAGEKLPTLIFANALLRNAIQRNQEWQLPLQLAVIGPTQSGKSSVVNLLLGRQMAAASPLAGHTRFAHGFVSGEVTAEYKHCLKSVLTGWQQVEPGSPGEGDSFSLTRTDVEASFMERPSIVWDTPDFDSVGSRSYRNTVPEICALADVLLLVVSREKYADRSVWRMLRLIAPLGIPMMICLNKTEPAEQAAIINSLEKRLQSESFSHIGVLSLPYVEQARETLASTGAAQNLRARLAGFLGSPMDSRSSGLLIEYLNQHWSQWTAPVRRELVASDYWESAVQAGIEEALASYRRECLDNPHYSYTLQRAILRLLELLEIPGIAAALTKVRSVLTWPARRLQALYKERFPGKDAGGQDQEANVLKEAVSHLLIGLQRQAGEQLLSGEDSTHAWWRELLALLNRESTETRRAAEAAVADYQAGFETEIEEASRRLYSHLQQHPATLNGLRAARVTTDAAAIVLAVKTGGIGINDLILTPAMLSFTSLLAEGAVGGYMKQIEAELKERQLVLLQQALFQDVLTDRLLHLWRAIPEARCYAISPELMEHAEQSLKALAK
ncbi:MAG: GTPase domain-containing protein [Gammaproteobacteria bacterium]|nr:GTPase domain-containing protein [Gammaproteobacteria bacterium]